MEKIDTPYDQIDFNTLVDISISLSRLIDDKLYGAVYTRFVKRFTMQFEAERIGKTPPDDSEDWEWSRIREYLEQNRENYPYGFNAVMYAMAKTEVTLQGKTGVGSRVSLNEMAKSMNKRLGDTQQSEFPNLVSAFKQIVNKLVALNVFPPNADYSAEDCNTVSLLVDGCAFKDVCQKLRNENITRYGNKEICSIGSMLSTYLELEFSRDHDYAIEHFANPHCKIKFAKTK